MSEETLEVQPSTSEQPVAQELPEQIFEFQPTDDEGNPIGGKQVFKYKTQEELQEQLRKQNTELIKLNRRLTRDARLGTILKDDIPEDAPRVPEGKYDFAPVPLTAEERLQIVQQLNDPETADMAADRLIKARIGDPEAIRWTLTQTRQELAALHTQKQAEAFVRSTPGYYICPQNSDTIMSWMLKNNLEPVKENFKLAYDTLGPDGANVLTQKPHTVAVSEHVEATTPIETAPAPQRRPASSGLTRENSSDTGPAPKKGYTPEEIDKMSSADYKRLILDPDFRAKRQAQRV